MHCWTGGQSGDLA